MKDSYCTEFITTFPAINIDIAMSDNKLYDYLILSIYLNKLHRGFKAKKINKTTKKGTTVVYKKLKNSEDIEDYKELLILKIIDFNTKWDEDLELVTERAGH